MLVLMEASVLNRSIPTFSRAALRGSRSAMSLREQTESILTTDGIVVEMAMLVAFTAMLVWYYRAKDVPWAVSAVVFLSWLLGFLGTLLLPADIVLTLLNGEHR